MTTPNEKFYRSLLDSLEKDLEYRREDLDREYAKWIAEKGNTRESLGQFFRESFEIGRQHYRSAPFDMEEKRYQKLRDIELLYFSLLIEERNKVTPATINLIQVDMAKANLHRFECNVEIIAPHQQCQYALQFDGKQYPLDEAMRNFPLDFNKCDREMGCACLVGFEGVRDEDGRLKKK